MLPRLHRLFVILLLAALPVKGIAAVLMPGCAAMAAMAAMQSMAPAVAPCHEAPVDAAAAPADTTANEGCTCGPCLAPMLAAPSVMSLPGTDRAEARPAARVASLPEPRAAVPRPPPRA